MLKHRLIFGTAMTVFFIALVLADAYIDGSISGSADNRPIQATGLYVLIAVLIALGVSELSRLTATKNVTIFKIFAVVAAVALCGTWYWPQVFGISADKYLAGVAAAVVLALFFRQYLSFGASGILNNCGANLFAIFYLGLLAAFVLAIRIELGPWPLLMFVVVVKCADIGAYTAGSLWGRHKFSPRISPGKTWEGMAGAIIFAVVASVIFALAAGLMPFLWACVFGFAFAFIGQLGDLAESLIKRDAEQKDASGRVPGFGGLLDVIDSPLAAAPLAYLFFCFF